MGFVAAPGHSGHTKLEQAADFVPLDLSSSTLVQLRAEAGACWQSEHGSAAKNTATTFVSKTGSAH